MKCIVAYLVSIKMRVSSYLTVNKISIKTFLLLSLIISASEALTEAAIKIEPTKKSVLSSSNFGLSLRDVRLGNILYGLNAIKAGLHEPGYFYKEGYVRFLSNKHLPGYRLTSIKNIPSFLIHATKRGDRVAISVDSYNKAQVLSVHCNRCTEEEMAKSWSQFIEDFMSTLPTRKIIQGQRVENYYWPKSAIMLIFNDGFLELERDRTFIVAPGELWEINEQDEEWIARVEDTHNRSALPRPGNDEVLVTCRCVDEDILFDDGYFKVKGSGANYRKALANAKTQCRYSNSDLIGTGPFYVTSCRRID